MIDSMEQPRTMIDSMEQRGQKRSAEAFEDSWQCPKCNNVNFGDRIVCNMRKCGAPRPGTELAENETDFLSNLLEGGEGAATKKSAIEQRQDSWSCLKCGNLNFGDRAYCNMRKCGAPKPLPERGHLEQGWQCSACGNSNFADRQYCNLRKCGAPRPGFQQMPWPNLMGMTMFQKGYPSAQKGAAKGGIGGGSSWQCECGNTNFKDRAFCNMRKCGKPRVLEAWLCSACGNRNFADRDVCNMRKCGTPRHDCDLAVFQELFSKGFVKGKGKGTVRVSGLA